MLPALLLQLYLSATPPQAQVPAPDSARDARLARRAQAAFEQQRRGMLPWSPGGGGYCDVRIGRFCWWYDGGTTAPAEPEGVAPARHALLRRLDSLGRLHPGDAWTAGMRVHYRVEGGEPLAADSAARECRSATWWCTALGAYAAHGAGDAFRADSQYLAAIAAMPDTLACQWRDIAPLLAGGLRDRYEHLSCDERRAVERRYWMLTNLQLAAGNAWRAEFYSRRVVVSLMRDASTPHGLAWGKDLAELVLRYGWPVAWSRLTQPLPTVGRPSVLGHDGTPSFAFAPREELIDSLVSAGDDAWRLDDVRAASRYAPPLVARVVPVAAQFARFRRGDSTLVAGAFTSSHDSLRAPRGVLVAALSDDVIGRAAPDSQRTVRQRLMIRGWPVLVGAELADSATRTLARSRQVYAPESGSPFALSDLLLFRGVVDDASSVEDAIARAIPGDTVTRSQPVGLFWEEYGATADTAGLEAAILVERIDRGLFRVARQRLGLADPDSPVRVRWSVRQAAVGERASRAITLDLSNLPAGRYRVSLTIGRKNGPEASRSRELELIER